MKKSLLKVYHTRKMHWMFRCIDGFLDNNPASPPNMFNRCRWGLICLQKFVENSLPFKYVQNMFSAVGFSISTLLWNKQEQTTLLVGWAFGRGFSSTVNNLNSIFSFLSKWQDQLRYFWSLPDSSNIQWRWWKVTLPQRK